MTKIDPYSLTTVPLEQCANGNSFGIATGFIWQRREQHYLITNWHVVAGRNARTGEIETPVQPDMLRAHFNTRVMNFGKVPHDIKIRDTNHNPLWYIYPGRQRGCDVVAVPLPIPGNDQITNMYPINALRSDSDLAVRIGMDAYILGYPFGNQPPGFPVWKRGSIASEPDLTKLGDGYMLVDTASRPGMSGSSSDPTQLGNTPIGEWWHVREQHPSNEIYWSLFWAFAHQRPIGRPAWNGVAG
jgi:hypothetical protein